MTDDEVRDEVRQWLAANWNAELDRGRWAQLVFDAGWAVPSWEPAWWGRGLSDPQSRIVAAEFAAVGAPGTGHDRANLFACTLHDLGTDEQKHRLIPPSIRGETKWCLLYSEPGAGSDLAGLRTRAERDGDEWVIDGQKVWTSFAKLADYGLLIARTDWDVAKHNGISFFMFPMRQPGVEVRPIRQITDESSSTRCSSPAPGCPMRTWSGTPATAGGAADGALLRASVDGRPGADVAAAPQAAGRRRRLVELARAAGPLGNRSFARGSRAVEACAAVNRWNTQRAKANRSGPSSPIMSLGKLAMSRILHEEARCVQIAGAESLLDGPDNPRGDDVNFLSLNAYFTSIGGGTDQIQRNIIAERVLGLPKSRNRTEIRRFGSCRPVREGAEFPQFGVRPQVGRGVIFCRRGRRSVSNMSSIDGSLDALDDAVAFLAAADFAALSPPQRFASLERLETRDATSDSDLPCRGGAVGAVRGLPAGRDRVGRCIADQPPRSQTADPRRRTTRGAHHVDRRTVAPVAPRDREGLACRGSSMASTCR